MPSAHQHITNIDQIANRDHGDLQGLTGAAHQDHDIDSLPPLICEVYSGTYTGDGTISQAIAGAGFRPKMVFIWKHVLAETGSVIMFIGTDAMAAGLVWYTLGASTDILDNRLISLDADGFTVDDDGTDGDPNKNLQDYNFICFG